MELSLLKGSEIIKKALIVGGGAAGLEVANKLAENGIEVILVEKENELGGNLKHVDPLKIAPQIQNVRKNRLIKVFVDTEIDNITGTSGNFIVKLKGKYKETLVIGAIIMTTGCCPSLENFFNLGISSKVIGQFDLDLKLARDEILPERICFLLDLADEGLKIGTSALLRQILTVKDKFNSDIFVICKDVKVSFDGGDELYRLAREKGAIFIKYAEEPEIVFENEGIKVRIKEEEPPCSITEIFCDLLVVEEKILPRTGNFAEMLKVTLDSNGFFQEDNIRLLPTFSARRGLFFVGGCRLPQNLSETITEAQAGALEILAFLAQNTTALREGVAEVDSEKCVLCLTCIRTCPHVALVVDHEAESAKVIEVACQKCGICVAECPVRAIKLT